MHSYACNNWKTFEQIFVEFYMDVMPLQVKQNSNILISNGHYFLLRTVTDEDL
jgi:hypothetical protein